jgi:3-oxoadipate CoA-transferase, alpha subunit
VIDKVVPDVDDAVSDLVDGVSIAIAGFCGPGDTPSYLIRAVAKLGLKDLTLIATDLGTSKSQFDRLRSEYEASPVDPDGRARVPIPGDFLPVAYLIDEGQVKKVITSMASQMSPHFEGSLELAVRRGEIDVEITGQGTLSERLRAGRAGIAAFYSPIGSGTFTADGKEVRVFDGAEHVLEYAIRPDFALITADRADRFGNLTYRGTGRAINPVIAGCARITIAEVEEVVDLGTLHPDEILTPGIYVDRVVVRHHGASR